MKNAVILLWVLGTLLAISHLWFLGGGKHPPGFWAFAGVLLVCYSLPFFVLTRIRIPREPSPERLMTQVLFVAVLTVGLLLPTRRFMPGYRPQALEALAYLFVPAFECGLIAIFFPARSVLRQLSRKK